MESHVGLAEIDGALECTTRDAEGNEYRYTVDGIAAVITRCLARTAVVRVPPMLDGYRVAEVGPNAFSASEKIVPLARPQVQGRGDRRIAQSYLDLRQGNRNAQIERVELPEGITRIGRAAFRGCNRLAEVTLPDTLEEICDLAFSCTALRSVRLPRSCVRLSELALRLGPETMPGVDASYASKLERIAVDPDNPVYCMAGPLLCRRIEDTGMLEVVLCPCRVGAVELDGPIARVSLRAFEGTFEIVSLHVNPSVAYDPHAGLVSHAACAKLIVDDPTDSGQMVLEMPDAALSRTVMGSTRGSSRVDAKKLAAVYDGALPNVRDQLDRMRLMLARVADCRYLGVSARRTFVDTLTHNLDALVANFGARGMWGQYDLLAAAGILTGATVSHAIDVLSVLADTASVGYLLELKRSRFAETAWDYAL